MNNINQEIIGNMATVYMKDGTIKNGRILSIRTEVEEMTALEFETKPARDPYSRARLMELTEFLDTTRIEAIDPYCK